MSSNKHVFKYPQLALKEAKKHLRSLTNIGKPSRAKLADAWETILQPDQPCSSRSADYVSIIADCNPRRRGALVTLYEAVRIYSSKCLTPTFWDEKLKKTLSSGDKTDLLSFMNQKFLDQYRRDNTNERKLHISTIGGPNCCKPYRSHNALVEALAPEFGLEGGESFEKIAMDHNLEDFLQKHLFKPCDNYTRLLDHLMDQAADAADYCLDGNEAFVDRQTLKFKDALFRYKYCLNFKYLDGPKAKLDRIIS